MNRRIPLLRRRQIMRAIDRPRFTAACREGLTIRALMERFSLSHTNAETWRRRALDHGRTEG